MTRLHRLFEEQGQSPWLDDSTRRDLRDGTLERLVAAGVRGVTANPTIVARAIEDSDTYHDQLASLLAHGVGVEDAYWEMEITDVADALEILGSTFRQSRGDDGFVSIEVAPRWARDAKATARATRVLQERIGDPPLFVKIPASPEGVQPVEAVIGEGRNINVTLLFSLSRYREILQAYLSAWRRSFVTAATSGQSAAWPRSS